jgi:hypothetical protein
LCAHRTVLLPTSKSALERRRSILIFKLPHQIQLLPTVDVIPSPRPCLHISKAMKIPAFHHNMYIRHIALTSLCADMDFSRCADPTGHRPRTSTSPSHWSSYSNDETIKWWRPKKRGCRTRFNLISYERYRWNE